MCHAVGSLLHYLGSFAALWLPAALGTCQSTSQLPAALVEPFFSTTASCLQASLDLLERSHSAMPELPQPEHAQFLAATATEAALAIVHVALNQSLPSAASLALSVSRSNAARVLNHCAVRFVTVPKLAAAGVLARCRNESWTCLVSIHLVWRTHVRGLKESDWSEAAHALASAVAPITGMWVQLHSNLRAGVSPATVQPQLDALHDVMAALCNTAAMLPRLAREAVLHAVKPGLEAGTALLATAKAVGAVQASNTISQTLLSVVRGLLGQLPAPLLQELLAVMMAELAGGPASPATQMRGCLTC